MAGKLQPQDSRSACNGPAVTSPAPSADARLIASYARDSAHRGLQPTTIEMRTTRLRCFAVWLDRPLSTATSRDIERFLAGRSIGVRTRYTWLSHLSCFYRWGVRRDYFTSDPTARIDRPRLPRLLPRPIGDVALAEAIGTADGRLKAMLLLASHMGLRCCEISRLHANDVLDTADTPMLLIHGKGGKDRLIPLHPLAAAALGPLPKRGFLFRRPEGTPLSAAQVSVAMRAQLRDHGIDATGHQLRHWFATRLYRTTRDLRLTQELLGHASPTTTAVYTAWAVGDAAAAVGGVGLDAA